MGYHERNIAVALLMSMTSCYGLQIVDLTHPQSKQSVYWPYPGASPFKYNNYANDKIRPGITFFSSFFTTGEHCGTHVDAPKHFIEGGKTINDVVLEDLIGQGVVIDVSKQASENPDYKLSVDDILDWEKSNGPIPEGAFVMMDSGWTSKFPNNEEILGTKTPSDPSTFHFPGFDPEAATFLIKKKKVKMIGVDTPSVDHGQTKDFQAHINIFSNGLVAAENVANLNKLPKNKDFTLCAIPTKIEGGSGSPARIFAIIDNNVIKDPVSVKYNGEL